MYVTEEQVVTSVCAECGVEYVFLKGVTIGKVEAIERSKPAHYVVKSIPLFLKEVGGDFLLLLNTD
jgi:hypothetical protein